MNNTTVDLSGNKITLTRNNAAVGVSPDHTILLPKAMTLAEARHWLTQIEKQDEMVRPVIEVLDAFPYEALYAFNVALKRLFGFVQTDESGGTFKIPINAAGDTVDAQFGDLAVPGVDGTFNAQPVENFTKLQVLARIKHKHVAKFEQLIAETKRILREESIYKGKALMMEYDRSEDRMKPPVFMDVARAPKPILPVDLEIQMRADIYNQIQYADLVRLYARDLKRGALFAGPYGTGKSMAARYLAHLSEQHGRTYFYVRNIEDLELVFDFAMRYTRDGSAALVFAEDVDRITDPQRLSSVLDGVSSKGKNIMLVMTTNFIENIPQVLMRPGRLDTVVFFRAPDAAAAESLIRCYAGEFLADDADLTAAAIALQGQIPSVIQEAIQKSLNHSISRMVDGEDDTLRITTGDIIAAFNGMRDHLDYLNRPVMPTVTALEKFGTAIGNRIASGMTVAIMGTRNEIGANALDRALSHEHATINGKAANGHAVYE